MQTLQFEKIRLDLKVTWAISRNSSQFKENIILKLRDAISEIAPNVRYNESPEKAMKELESLNNSPIPLMNSIEQIEQFMSALSFSNSTSFAVESLLVQDLCNRKGQSINELLAIAETSIDTSFSLPIMEVSQLEEYLQSYPDFKVYKIKVNKMNAVEVVKRIQQLTDAKLRIDANEDFDTAQEVLSFLGQVDESKVEFLEQPLSASNQIEQKKLFEQTDVTLIADESIENNLEFDHLKDLFDGINIKLMKSGSILHAHKQLLKAKSLGMKTMIGCMIETSVGISFALRLAALVDYADLDGHLLIKNDPFQMIKNEKGRLSLL